MADTRLKHKPNEKHTLDEVLKSLRDLVSNEVLEKSRPPLAEPKSAFTSETTVDMRDILSSLENLLADDLNIENRPATPATTAETETPRAAVKVPPKAKARAPTVANMEEAIEAAEAVESALTVTDETSVSERTIADEAPALELTIEEPPSAPAKGMQQELSFAFDAPGRPAIDVERAPVSTDVGLPTIEVEETPLAAGDEAAFASDTAAELEMIADEIMAAPAPSETAPAADSYGVDFASDTDLTSAENAGAPEELSFEAPPTRTDTPDTIEYTPSAKTTLEPDNAETAATLEDLTPPVHDEPPASEDAILERSEPPHPADAQTGDSDSGSSLGEVVELDVSAPEPAAASQLPLDNIPVLEDVALAPPRVNKPAPVSPSSPDRVREMAVKVIARLNIELRKAGKPPLDAKTVHRLQQLLREALEKSNEK